MSLEKKIRENVIALALCTHPVFFVPEAGRLSNFLLAEDIGLSFFYQYLRLRIIVKSILDNSSALLWVGFANV